MFTIYTLGDIGLFRQILNASAMVFNSGIMSSGSGIGAGSAIAAGALISLMIAIGTGMLGSLGAGKKFNPAMVFVMLIVYAALTGPKVTVQIEDVYSGAVTTVDNIPIGVAVPAGVIGLVTHSLTQTIETAFSTTNGNYISMSSQGFVTPLKLLLAMRAGAVSSRDPWLVANMQMFTIDCLTGGTSTFSQANFVKSSDVVEYMTTNFHPGLTTYFSAGAPSGVGMSCADSATAIAAAADAFVLSAEFNRAINASMPSKANPNTVIPNKYSVGDVDNTHAALVAPLWGGMQDAQKFMKNALLAEIARDSVSCLHTAADYSAFNACQDDITSSAMMTAATEQWKVDSTANASFFKRNMLPGMNLLLALFYAFAPLMFILSVMMGAAGLGILLKYFQFGLWSQTWMPFAAVINFIIQAMVADDMIRMAEASPNGLTIEVYSNFYNMMSTKLAMASDMLAMVPMISYALLTGGAYAMTQIAGKWGMRDSTDEKILAPSLAVNGPMMQSSAALTGLNGGALGDANKADGTTYTVGNSLQRANSQIASAISQTSQSAQELEQRAFTNMASSSKGVDHANAIMKEAGITGSKAYENVTSKAMEIAKKNNLTDEQSKRFVASASAGLKFAGSGASAGMDWADGSKESKAWDELQKDGATSSDRAALQAQFSTKGTTTNAFKTAATQTLSEQDSKSYAAAKSRLDSLTSAQQSMLSATNGVASSTPLSPLAQTNVLNASSAARAAVHGNYENAIRDMSNGDINAVRTQAMRDVQGSRYGNLMSGDAFQSAVDLRAMDIMSSNGNAIASAGVAASVGALGATAGSMGLSNFGSGYAPSASTNAHAAAGGALAGNAAGVGGDVGSQIAGGGNVGAGFDANGGFRRGKEGMERQGAANREKVKADGQASKPAPITQPFRGSATPVYDPDRPTDVPGA